MRARAASGGRPLDVVRHAQFTAAVPDERCAVLVEDRLIPAVNGDVVDHVVGDDDVPVALNGHPPAGPQCGDLVAPAVHQQGAVAAVDRLDDAITGEVRIAQDVSTDDTVVGAVTQQRIADRARTRLRSCAGNSDGHRYGQGNDTCRYSPGRETPHHGGEITSSRPGDGGVRPSRYSRRCWVAWHVRCV